MSQKLQAEQGNDIVLPGSVARESTPALGQAVRAQMELAETTKLLRAEQGFYQQMGACKDSGAKPYVFYPATSVSGFPAAIPSIRREDPAVNRFKPSSAPMAPVEFHGG